MTDGSTKTHASGSFAPPGGLLAQLTVELKGIELDPQKAAENKARRLQRLDTVTIPALRFVGFGGLSLCIYIYLRFFEHRSDAGQWAIAYAGVAFAYCLVSILILQTGYRRLGKERLALVMLALDVLLHIGAIYATGGEESWLVALLLLRMADQATTGLRRALFFTHFNVLCFLGLMVYLDLGEGRALDWPRELTKAGLLYSAGVWISLSSRGGDRRRRQVSAAIEVTRRMVLELEAQALRLDEAKVRAEAANQAKTQFLANMSHELRTPLSAVIGIADLLAKEDLSANQREFVTLLQTSASSLLDVIDDILDFSKVEAGKVTMSASPCQLAQVVEAVVRLLEHRAEERGVELRSTIPDNLPWVDTDSARVRQILFNLIGNAIKFTSEGSVDVRLRELGRDEASVQIRIEVEDTGIGISASDQRRLFEPFTQVDNTSSRRHGGTGLGLAIARRLVGLLGGTLGVRSRLGEGSTFWLEMSCDRTDAPELPGACRRDRPARHPAKGHAASPVGRGQPGQLRRHRSPSAQPGCRRRGGQ